MRTSTVRRLFTIAALALPAVAISATAAHAEDLQFTLHNNSDLTLTAFYVEPASSKDWGANILSGTIAPGESATVTIADGKTTCNYGIRGEFKEGQPVDHDSLNLCELGSYTYTK
jgi:hypothetical protein